MYLSVLWKNAEIITDLEKLLTFMIRLKFTMDSQNLYCVSRPIYSERAFEHVNEKQIRETKTIKERVSNSVK